MTLKLEFETDNGKPFDDPAERDRILRGIAHGNRAGAIRDLDGNKIGQYTTTEEAGTGPPSPTSTTRTQRRRQKTPPQRRASGG